MEDGVKDRSNRVKPKVDYCFLKKATLGQRGAAPLTNLLCKIFSANKPCKAFLISHDLVKKKEKKTKEMCNSKTLWWFK